MNEVIRELDLGVTEGIKADVMKRELRGLS